MTMTRETQPIVPESLAFDVDFDGFSGPLDLLCLLVESREIEAASVPLAEVVHRYASFLLRSREVPISRAAEFLALAARLLLGKIRALFPDRSCEEAVENQEGAEEEDLLALLERYRPYRRAAALLARLQKERERRFLRPSEEGPLFYDLGDLWSLSLLWWERIAACRNRRSETVADDEVGRDDGIPEAIPDEVQVERRMAELALLVADEAEEWTLSRLIRRERGRIDLIVTLLALLEMSRLGRISLRQEEMLGDVQIRGTVLS